MYVCAKVAFSHVHLYITLWAVALQTPLSVGFSRQEYWNGWNTLLQGIFSTQGWNPYLSHFVPWFFTASNTWEAWSCHILRGKVSLKKKKVIQICRVGEFGKKRKIWDVFSFLVSIIGFTINMWHKGPIMEESAEFFFYGRPYSKCLRPCRVYGLCWTTLSCWDSETAVKWKVNDHHYVSITFYLWRLKLKFHLIFMCYKILFFFFLVFFLQFKKVTQRAVLTCR